MNVSQIQAVIESLLFIAGDAVPLTSIAQTIELDKSTTKSIIQALADQYEQEQRGLRIVCYDGAYQLCTAPECFGYIRNLYKSPQKQVLTQALLETLAIIAYKQPITKSEIEDIRGVNVDHAVNKLIERNLICEVGRRNVPGKPILFGTTDGFLRHFGFRSVQELPSFDDTLSVEETT